MGKPACNVAMYHPDLRVLSARYRNWHVKALLDEASVLIERCLTEFKEYSSLDYAWTQFQLGLKIQEKQIDIDRVTEPEAPPGEAEAAALMAEAEAAEEEPAEEEAHVEERGEEETAEAPPDETYQAEATPPLTTLELQLEAVKRKRELSAPGQPFALNDQRDLALKRLCRDYEETVNRAWVCEQGLRKIYDYEELESPLPVEAETLSESLTSLAIWIRSASEWLTRYEQHQQTFTRVISLRALMGRTAWAVLKQSRESYSTRFRLPPELFKGHDNCHLRGVGAWLMGDCGAVPWTLVVRVPEEGVYERWGQSVEVDQSGRASCLLGRVENRKSLHPVQMSGENTLLNATPLGLQTPGGQWYLEIQKPAGAITESFAHLEDLILELSVVGIPQRSMNVG
ncbi:hypothetical protein L4X63_07035 [Geomonas sp. Red32]|uniref:hypothetical protein n=1 Tax=Geomonas sp. Red32 TaxID=2912856 RepID=UPI00202CC66B|nr:hypothetical protein [Geomonas sp. Red32]MCM0081340.1 hypothetical protein [Geomonas sp. Red32]